MRSLTNRQLLVGGFVLAGVATLVSFLILVGGLADGRRARALETTVDELRGELQDVRTSKPPQIEGASSGSHAAIALIASRLRNGLQESLRALPDQDSDLSMRVVPAEGVRKLVEDLEHHLDLAELIYEQSRALATKGPKNTGTGG